ncbi:MAG: outer membrane protein assembly factor BamB [Halioglobus sp.]|jgi:outer membrane protein assembly factor BamB
MCKTRDLLIIVYLLFFFVQSDAQSFFKKYSLDDTSWIERKFNIHLLEGNLFATTLYSSGPTLDPFSELMVDQLDMNNGDIISRIKFPNEYSFVAHKSVVYNNSIFGIGWQSNQGGFNTESIGLYKVSSDKELQYFMELGDSTRRDIPIDLIVNTNEEIVIVSNRKFESGGGTTSKGVVTKTDSEGSRLWEYVDDIASARIEMRSVTIDDNDNIYALSNQDGIEDSVRLTKLTPDGSKIWTRTYQEGFHSKSQQIRNLKNGNLLIAGYAFYDKYGGQTSNFYMEIDTAGNPIWIKDYRPDIGGVAFESEINILEDGRIARVYDGFGYPTLMVNHPNGVIDFIRNYDDLDVRFPDDLLQLDDGSFVIIGWINPNLNPDGFTSWMMRTDTEGNLVTSISEINSIEADFSLYPNPTSSILNIEFEKDSDLDRIVVFDLWGTEIQEYEPRSQINVLSLKSGTYILCRIDKDGHVKSNKFVKL